MAITDAEGEDEGRTSTMFQSSCSVCSVCLCPIAVTNAELVRQHGPVASRCPGSRRPPAVSPPAIPQPSTRLLPCSKTAAPPSLTPAQVLTNSTTQEPPPRCSVKLLKRVPWSSREQAASKLALILDALSEDMTTPPGIVFCILVPSASKYPRVETSTVL